MKSYAVRVSTAYNLAKSLNKHNVIISKVMLRKKHSEEVEVTKAFYDPEENRLHLM